MLRHTYMNLSAGVFPKVFVFLLFMSLPGIYDIGNSRAYGDAFLKNLCPAEIGSVRELGNVVLRIDQHLKNELARGKETSDSQKQVLVKSGECIGALVAFQAESTKRSMAAKQEEKYIFLNVRSILKQILIRNENIINDIQENTLDTLEDPVSFLKSPAWQDPQYLISLSSYWMGWNGYYASMLFDSDDPMIDTLLTEAIDGFSRSFIDFKEDPVVTRSLLGRALCYGKQKAYDRARQDFKSVKKKVGKDDPLFMRCLYEEIRMLYETGNHALALRMLEEFREDFPEEKIPEYIRMGLDQINAKVVVALVKKEDQGDTDAASLSRNNQKKTMETLRQLEKSPAGMTEVYRYVRDNPSDFEVFSYKDLGPVAAAALGDVMFESSAYDRALTYYLPVLKDNSATMGNHLDDIWFHTAYIYCKKEKYEKALYYLKTFHKKFPNSVFIEQAVSLYYVAGNRHYRNENSHSAYNIFIDAAGTYIKKCGGNCPELSDAHYTMGKYYQQQGDNKKAAKAFSKVHPNSLNYVSAKYAQLQYYVVELQLLEKNGRHHSGEAKKIYQEGVGLLETYRNNVAHDKKQAIHAKKIEPYMLVLESNLCLYGNDTGIRKNLDRLKGFEKRFPQEGKLSYKAFQIRMIMYQHLGMREEGEQELRDLAEKKPINRETYTVLRRLAKKFDRGGQAQKEGASGGAERYREFALMTYECLYNISCSLPGDPKNCDFAQLAMARIYIDQDKLGKAERVYQDILKRNSLSADAVYNLGNLYEKKKDWEKALNTWRTFSDGVQTGTYHWFEARYKTAFALSKLGDVTKACDVLNITLVLHPDLGSDEMKSKYQTLKKNICKGELPL